VVSASPPSRRAFLTAGSAAAAAALLSACGGAKPLREEVRSGGKVTRADVEPLNALLDLEHYAIAAYAAGIPLLHPPQSESAIQFLAQELAHATQLSDLIRLARAKPNLPQAKYDLGHPKRPADVLAFLMHLERAQLSAYLSTLPRLSNGRLRAAMTSIFANDAQHLAMLRWQTGHAPVPGAQVTGR
jgi:bacterioferritin (cytochrome b1)